MLQYTHLSKAKCEHEDTKDDKNPRGTFKFAPSGNNGRATKTSKEPGDRPPYPGWEVVGPRLRGEAFLPLRALREAAQRANRKGSNNPDTPR
uniref:RxLR effector candidate protein n=1 Tax=Hyaloperonospora arabidopsidis (strain Emoy2) TaxID=559515 RepID=M4C2I3_HYAAE